MNRRSIILAPTLFLVMAAQSSTGAPGALAATPNWSNQSLGATFSTTVQADAAVAMDPAGTAVSAWSAPSGVLVTTRMKGGGWSPRTNLTQGGAGDSVQVAAGPDGTEAVAWIIPAAKNTPARIAVTVRPPAQTWPTAPDVVPAYPYRTGYLKLGVAGNGTATLVWGQADSTAVRTMASSRPAGGAWSAPVSISPPGVNTNIPDLDVNPSGAALAVWQESPSGAWNPQAIGAAYRSSSGMWTPSQIVSGVAVTTTWNPKPTIDAAGNAAVAFVDHNTMTVATRSKSGHWAPPLALSAPTADYPTLAADSAGDLVAAWRSLDAQTGNYQVLVRSFSGRVWSAATALGDPQNSADQPTAAYAGNGRLAVITWVDDTALVARAAVRTKGAGWVASTIGGGGGLWGTPVPVAAGGGVAAVVRTATVAFPPDLGRLVGSTYGG